MPEAHRNALRELYDANDVLAGKKAMIVDDDMRNIFALSMLLEDRGMVVVPHDNGRDAIMSLRTQNDIDVVLMDIMMPELDGIDTIREIRRIPACKDIPIIAVTAKAMKGDREKCMEAGAWDYLSKPVDPDLIVDDRADKLLAFRTILEDLGQNLYTAASGADALRQVLYRDFAVILLDVNMPGIDGLETASLIRKRRKSAHTPIIFITADFNDEAHQSRGYALGAVDYIGSPVVPEVLRAKVKVFVDLYLLAEQAKRQAQERLILAEERAARAAAERATQRLELLARASATLA